MRDPIVRPRGSSPEASVARSPDSAVVTPAPASPSLKRRPRPGWKATIVRHESFAQLRAIQKSTTDPSIDLSYLTDACLRIALEMGRDAIVQRALADLRPARTTSP